MPTVRLSLVLAFTLIACGSKAKPPPSPTAAPAARSVTATPASASTREAASTSSVTVSDDIAARCKLHFTTPSEAPNFGFDEAELMSDDRAALQQIADCLVKGPLKGRSVQLVGRADPRGTDEYNLGLGTRRAETVRGYLQRLGVPADRLAPTTRGELDATGIDETGWQHDRRVDLELVN